MKTLLIAITVALANVGTVSWAAAPIHTQQVQFKQGESAATIKGSLKGEQIVDYKLRARVGQTMRVTMNTSSTSAYFNVLPPGSETALFVGSTSGNEWTGTLPTDGEYTVRTYLMRSAARRNESATYTLTIGITGSAAVSQAPGSAPAGEEWITITLQQPTGRRERGRHEALSLATIVPTTIRAPADVH